LVVAFHGGVVKTKVAWEVLAPEQLFASTNLVVELVKHVVVWEAMWNLEAFNWEVVIGTVSDNLKHTSIKFLDNFDGLLAVMDCSHFSVCVLFLYLRLVLLEGDMRQLDGIGRMVLFW